MRTKYLLLILDKLSVSIQSIYFIAENDPFSMIPIWFPRRFTSLTQIFPIGSIPLLFKTDNRLFDSATYILPLPPKLEKFYAHKILVHSTPLANVNFTSGDNVQILDANWIRFDSCNSTIQGLSMM
jgi:hypothetical protein